MGTMLSTARPAGQHSSGRTLRGRTAWVVALLSIALAAGCSSGGHQDLENYVARIKAKKSGRIEPLPEFKTYESYAYAVDQMRDPFTPSGGVPDEIPETTGTGISPNMNRNREALEAFPLDTLKFVGHLAKGGQEWAVVTAPDDLVYRVTEGNYMGQNYGRITAISESKIQLTEIVSDGMGGWIERPATLAIADE